MDFENDVFLSYAHIDEQVLAEGQKGWISSLHQALEVRLGQLLGKDPKIWRDPKLQGNDVFTDRLIENLPRVAVLVSILSPRYVKSEWCQRELNEFLKACETTGGGRLAHKLRVFKVVKTPVPLEQHPPGLQLVLGYEFYTVEPQSGRPRELHAAAPPDAQRLYWEKLDDLAHDIADLLNALYREASGTPIPTAAEAPADTVYLAETSSDLKERRDSIKRELQAHGYAVLPDQPLPLVASEAAATVRAQLARCRLSIHIVGQNYGLVPEGATTSIVALQHELAIERAASGDFVRLIWMPPGLSSKDERQQRFIEQLETDPRNDTGADLLKTSIEDFKSVLHVRLTPPAPPAPKPEPPPGRAAVPTAQSDESLKRIYLICDQRDLDSTRGLEDLLFGQFEVILPVFDGDESRVRRDHEENLADCDAALVYYGAGNELWLRSKLRELQKIAGYGRTKPILGKAVYVALPDTPEKRRFRTHDAIVINQGERLTPVALEPFLSRLR
jgi:TIR domain-containing protein/uncharacterized protein DUF4062